MLGQVFKHVQVDDHVHPNSGFQLQAKFLTPFTQN
jgi:hypothetical protein